MSRSVRMRVPWPNTFIYRSIINMSHCTAVPLSNDTVRTAGQVNRWPRPTLLYTCTTPQFIPAWSCLFPGPSPSMRALISCGT